MPSFGRVEGHGSFKSQLEIDSFHSLEEKLTSEHADWSRDQIQREALVVYNTRMLPKQVKSYVDEKSGKQEMDVDQGFDVIDGKLVHPEYGAFDNMIDKAQTEEERTQLKLWQETMVNAEPGTQVVSLDLSAIQRGGVRYADIAEKSADGKVKIEKRVDVARTGLLTLSDSWASLVHLAKTDGRKMVSNGVANVGLVVIDAKEKADTNRLALEITAATNREHIRTSVKENFQKKNNYDALTTVMVGVAKPVEKAVKDIKDSVIAVSGLVASKLRRQTERSPETARPKENLHKHKKKNKSRDTERVLEKENEPKRDEVVLMTKIVEKNSSARSELERRVEIKKIIFDLQKLAELPKLVQKKKEKKILRIKKNERWRGKRNELQKKLWKKEKAFRRKGKQEIKRGKKKEKKHIRLRERNKKREIVSWKTLRRLAKRIERVQPKKEKKIRREEKKQHVRRIVFAWMLLIVTSKYFHLSINESKKQKKEKVKKKEPTRWVLLAIIWHLNAIREHGKPVVYKKVKKKQTNPLVFPKQAVIFALAS